MTDSEIITQFETLVEDELDRTLEIQLANSTKNKTERDMKLEICKRLDESNTAAVAQTYTTPVTLPSGFRGLARKYIWVGTDKRYPKPYEDAPRWRNTGGFFYINHGAGTLHLTGNQATAATIGIPYIVKTPDISETTINNGDTTVTWPEEFHPLIPYDMVKLFDQIERGNKAYSWRAEWDAEYRALKQAMLDWDADLKLAALGGETPYGPEESGSGEYQINL